MTTTKRLRKELKTITQDMLALGYEKGDVERFHIEADELLLSALEVTLDKKTFKKLSKAYLRVEKWYA